MDSPLREVGICGDRCARPGEWNSSDATPRTLSQSLQVPELISQRRRWLNGSFFAAIHSTVHFHYIYRSSHSFLRKFWIHVEMLYQLFNLIFSWFALVRSFHHCYQLGAFLTTSPQGNYYISFIILSESMEDPSFHLGKIHILNVILEYLYLGLLIVCFLLALGNRPQGAKWFYTTAFLGFALITVYMTVRAATAYLPQRSDRSAHGHRSRRSSSHSRASRTWRSPTARSP